ncbi:hypothetical protein, unlikely [Trypanosoma brucei gambiense DAL972]|uniref:T. brucei spp.-specific protein n=1 Tax=Trypanosoma brucei gambiense (strain MHOM/CI/86/DAL972) TaxID=679716 RepID=C9ZYI7_TRYB9|nr:hypothetical protein, unlikely [Trypanosoma brucei gambiense DAL972]CBH14486.1 hypothetical protein, unlikely [Trypanosoma brucei gambiense DAL972]|eukprot:XP_011776752.1 hypothetical protein, unlikely [Trypanosoma brucei gambiense DAL972]
MIMLVVSNLLRFSLVILGCFVGKYCGDCDFEDAAVVSDLIEAHVRCNIKFTCFSLPFLTRVSLLVASSSCPRRNSPLFPIAEGKCPWQKNTALPNS